MQTSKPIISNDFSGFLVRVPLGTFFFLAGRIKLEDLSTFIQSVKSYNILPEDLATVYGVLLPYLEILTGACLVLGIWTTVFASVASVLLCSFIYALGIIPAGSNMFNKDILLLGGSLSLLASGAGFFSIDKFRRSS